MLSELILLVDDEPSIAREIAAAHGGRISVQSKTGAGTSMEVLLPLPPPDAKKTVR